MSAQNQLLRQLGFWDALTIGVGTMIGAGIFLLSGVAVALTGPAAIFSYLGAGLVWTAQGSFFAQAAQAHAASGSRNDRIMDGHADNEDDDDEDDEDGDDDEDDDD